MLINHLQILMNYSKNVQQNTVIILWYYIKYMYSRKIYYLLHRYEMIILSTIKLQQYISIEELEIVTGSLFLTAETIRVIIFQRKR